MPFLFFFFFNDTATTEIYTLSLHDALPICVLVVVEDGRLQEGRPGREQAAQDLADRKSTRLNSSHTVISYAVFCLKKKKKRNRRKDQENASNHIRKSGQNDRRPASTDSIRQ